MNFKSIIKTNIQLRILNPILFFFSGGFLCKKRIIVAIDPLVGSHDHGLDFFFIYSKRLKKELDVSICVTDISTAKIILRFVHFDIVGVKMHYTAKPKDVYRKVSKFRELAGRSRLVYFDSDDDLCIQFKDVLKIVDFYVKGHIFSNLLDYCIPRIGKNNLTDYVSKTYGTSFSDNIIPYTEPISEFLLSKIVLGFTLGLSKNIIRQRDAFPSHKIEKHIDIICRAGLGSGSWLSPLRKPLITLLEKLPSRWRVIPPSVYVTQDKYIEEMMSSKICVSPFGYGEICWRDFEAVIYGCVLIKPDMSHVKTRPNIFVPFHTYVPIKWDFSDLYEKCKWCLDNPLECERITTNARTVLEKCFEGSDFIDHVRELLERVPESTTPL